MRIGFFSDSFTPQLNGVATSMEAFARALEAQGHTVFNFVPAMDGYVDRCNHVIRLPGLKVANDPPFWLLTPLSFHLLRELPRFNLDVVHVHTPLTAHFLATLVARRARLPLLSSYHTFVPEYVQATLKSVKGFELPASLGIVYSAWLCNMADQVIAPSSKVKKCLAQYGVHRRTSIVPYGLDREQFANKPRGFLRARLGLKTSDQILLGVGRLMPEKNLEFTLEMLKALAPRYPHAYLVWVGQGPSRAEYEKRAETLGVRERVIFAGTIPYSEMANAYADADVFVNASITETFSMVTLEAIAAGLPCVIVRDEALQQMVIDGKNGFVSTMNAAEFATRVGWVLDDPVRAARMRAESLALARGFSIQEQAAKLVRIYEEVIELKNCRRAETHPRVEIEDRLHKARQEQQFDAASRESGLSRN